MFAMIGLVNLIIALLGGRAGW